MAWAHPSLPRPPHAGAQRLQSARNHLSGFDRIPRTNREVPPGAPALFATTTGFHQLGDYPSLNVRVLNETRDLYRFFDATRQAEFLADCVVETVRQTLPQEIEYLRNYDQAKRRIEAFLELPDATLDLTMGFLRQNDGRLSQRVRTKEFAMLTDEEASQIEPIYGELRMCSIDTAREPAREPTILLVPHDQ